MANGVDNYLKNLNKAGRNSSRTQFLSRRHRQVIRCDEITTDSVYEYINGCI